VSKNAKGGVSLSKVLSDGVRKYGKAIVANFAIALKVTRLYSFAHQNVKDALTELMEFINGFIRLEGGAQLLRVGDFLFLNEVRVRVDFGGYQSFGFVLDLLKERDIGEISFSSGVTTQELEALIELLNKPLPDSNDPWAAFSELLKQHRFGHISVAQHKDRPDLRGDEDKDARVVLIRSYFKTVQIVTDVFKAVATDRKMNLRRLKLAIHALVDFTLSEERLLLALANVRDHGERGANHAVNVGVLSIALGAKLGLSKKLLGELGIAAVLHDVGKVTLPDSLQSSCRQSLSSADAETYRQHASKGVECLLSQRVVDSIVKSINTTFLHHYRFDGTGYPKLVCRKEQNLFTRIIAVANFYENSTTANRLELKAKTPDAVMKTLMDRRGTEFDPLVVKAFVNLMGLYPVGCVVRLDTGEVATVAQPAMHPRFLDRPTVKLISDGTGNPSNLQVNLMDRASNGDFLRSILKIYQQEEVSLDLGEYLAVV
jgi:HD-GYP domain-containing protein (c-di-GMP phosphodiesterase class II)